MFRIGFFLFSIYFLYSDISPIFRNIRKEGFSIITEMFVNLTIYREKYSKNTSNTELRYFKNGDAYIGNFYEGSFNRGAYYKSEENQLQNELDFPIITIIFNITGDLNFARMSIDDFGYLL